MANKAVYYLLSVTCDSWLVTDEYATLCGPRQGQITDPMTGGITGDWRSCFYLVLWLST